MFHRSPSRVFHPLAAILIVCAGLAHAQSPKPEPIVTRMYPVADLVTPIPGMPKTQTDKSLPVSLMNLVRNTVSPATWSECGGQGTVNYHEVGTALVVAQTESVQKNVADLLAALRKLHDINVATEIRILHFTDASFGEFAKRAGLDKRNTATVDDTAAAALLKVMQANPESTVMCAPKLTTFIGQEATIRTENDQQFACDLTLTNVNGQTVFMPQNRTFKTGCQVTLRPSLTPDHKHVMLSFNAEVADLGDTKTPLFPVTTMITPVFEGGAQGQPVPFTQFVQQPQIVKRGIQQSLCLPDGQTAVIYAGRSTRTVTSDAKVPVLCELPIIGELFEAEETNQFSDHLVFMVRPKIIVVSDVEHKVVMKEMASPCTLVQATCAATAAVPAPCCPMCSPATCLPCPTTATAVLPAPCCPMSGQVSCMPCPPTVPAPQMASVIARVTLPPCCAKGVPCTQCPAAPVATAACTHPTPVCQPTPMAVLVEAPCCTVNGPGTCAACPKMIAPPVAPGACVILGQASPLMPVAKCAMPVPMEECKNSLPREKCVTLKATIMSINPEYFDRPDAAAWSDLSPKECDGKVKCIEAAVAERFCRAVRAQQGGKILAEPKMVTMSGQPGTFQTGREQAIGFTLDLGFGNGGPYANYHPETRFCGTTLTMTPVVSADGRYCRLAMCAEQHGLADKVVAQVSAAEDAGKAPTGIINSHVQSTAVNMTLPWGQAMMLYMPTKAGEAKEHIVVIVTPEK